MVFVYAQNASIYDNTVLRCNSSNQNVKQAISLSFRTFVGSKIIVNRKWVIRRLHWMFSIKVLINLGRLWQHWFLFSNLMHKYSTFCKSYLYLLLHLPRLCFAVYIKAAQIDWSNERWSHRLKSHKQTLTYTHRILFVYLTKKNARVSKNCICVVVARELRYDTQRNSIWTTWCACIIPITWIALNRRISWVLQCKWSTIRAKGNIAIPSIAGSKF